MGIKNYNINTAYVRLIRFFKIKNIDAFCCGIILMIIHLLEIKGEIYMSLDRTNWKIGQQNINVLYLGLILPNGVFIPVLWQLYNKRGNTSQEERCKILERFFRVWESYHELDITILGDREFVGAHWFDFLKKVNFSFVIRARWQDYWGEVSKSTNRLVPKLEKYIAKKVKKDGYFQTGIVLKGQRLYYTVFENRSKRGKKTDKWLVLISDRPDVDWISESFPKRWGIEVFFYHCKTNGFNLEDLNLQNLLKAQLMMGVVSICYILSVLKGMKCQKNQKINWKNYKNKKSRRSISIFRLGYDNLKNEVHTVVDLIDFVRQLLPSIPIWKAASWKFKFKSV